MRRSWSWVPGVLALVASLPAPSHAAGIQLWNPGRYSGFSCDAQFADRVVQFRPESPLGDTRTGLDGSAALCEPDDIGFQPEPDSALSVALGTNGLIELAFASTILNDGVLAPLSDPPSGGALPDGFELLIFEDGELDGASLFGRLASQQLVFLATVAEVADTNPTAPGLGSNERDTLIAIDLDAIFSGNVELLSVLIRDDGISEVDGRFSDTFEVDALMNLSPGRTTPVITPEPGTAGLLGLGLAALAARRRRLSRGLQD